MMNVFGNITSNRTTAWVAEPTVRGTWGILSTCILTISLCVWTAVHLNIPEHRKTKRQIWRKFKWLLLGLLAPEMVAYVAWHQRKKAKEILDHVRNCSGYVALPSQMRKLLAAYLRGPTFYRRGKGEEKLTSPILESHPNKRPGWTLVHGFYAAMGGFAMDCSTCEQPFLPENRTRAALTPDGLRFLLQHEPDSLPDISEEQILDKSKADGVKKFLVCAQALWFCLQCISRLAQALPVSLLELNTFGHSLCTLVIYLLWWHKPLNIDEPTLIQHEKLQPLFAYMWMTSKISSRGLKGYDIRGGVRDEFDGIWPYRNPIPADLEFGGGKTSPSFRQTLAQHEPSGTSTTSTSGQMDYTQAPYDWSWRRYSTTAFRFHTTHWLMSQWSCFGKAFRSPAGIGTRNTAIEFFSPSDLVRWTLASKAIKQYNLQQDIRKRHQNPTGAGRNFVPRLKPRIDNIIYELARIELWLGLAVAGFLYGGLHLVAWNAAFSSRLEEILWRIAASSVASTGILVGPLIIWSQFAIADRGLTGLLKRNWEGDELRQNKEHPVKNWGEIILAGLAFILLCTVVPLLWFTYLFSRVYLVVECFKNLAHLPASAYQVPQWSTYVPHIT